MNFHDGFITFTKYLGVVNNKNNKSDFSCNKINLKS